MIADQLAEDDGPVVIERRRSRHGNYYEEIPPEPEPTPVPVIPEHVPETPGGLVHVSIGEPGQVLTMGDYAKALTGSTSVIAPGQWNPTTDGTMFTSTAGYSISLNDVIGAGKGYQPVSTAFGSIEGVYDPAPNCDHNQTASYYGMTQCIDCGASRSTKECGHQYYDPVGKSKFKYYKDGDSHGGKSFQTVKCQGCGHEWVEETLF